MRLHLKFSRFSQSEIRDVLEEVNFDKYLKEQNKEPEKDKGTKRKKV